MIQGSKITCIKCIFDNIHGTITHRFASSQVSINFIESEFKFSTINFSGDGGYISFSNCIIKDSTISFSSPNRFPGWDSSKQVVIKNSRTDILFIEFNKIKSMFCMNKKS